MAEGLRWCPACLDAGFHTLLSSVRLVTRCPIHCVRLVDACPGCADGFRMRIGSLAVRPEGCRCGRTRWLDPQVARQSRLLPKDVEPWAPVARWVRQVESVRCSASPNGGLPPQVHLALTPRWCRDLGIGYPDCFEAGPALWTDADESGRWSTYQARSGDLGDTGFRTAEGGAPTPPQACVYRAMGRHLRRHGLSNPDRWIAELRDTGDPATFAMTMAARPKARAAFTEMLWSRLLEPQVHQRRWPDRPAPYDRTLSERTPIDLEPGSEPLRFDGPSVSRRAEQWLGYHALALKARLAWDGASRRTQRCIDDRWADWSRDEEALAGRLVWYSRPRGTGLQFVAYLRDIEARSFGSSVLTKKQRQDAFAQARLEQRRRLQALAGRDCLGWDRQAGWHVCRGARPDDAEVRLVRVLHVGARTSSWLFRGCGRFVARLAEGVVQVIADSPREALSGLRGAVVQHRRVCEANRGEAAHRPVPLALPSPSRGRLARAAVCIHSPAQGSDRFWRTSSAGMANARQSFQLAAAQGAD